MASRQELKTRLEKRLERTGMFVHANVQGDLDIEGNSITIEYTQNPKTKKTFKGVRDTLKNKLKTLIDQKYLLGISPEFKKPDRTQRYQDIFTRQPTEGMSDNPTEEFLKDCLNILKDKYIFED